MSAPGGAVWERNRRGVFDARYMGTGVATWEPSPIISAVTGVRQLRFGDVARRCKAGDSGAS